MKTYTHIITLYIDIKAKSKADSTRKFKEFDFKFPDPDDEYPARLCLCTYEKHDILEYPDQEDEQEDFDPHRTHASVDEAIAYCKEYDDFEYRVSDIVRHNLVQGEYGFARELLAHL